LNYAIKTVLFKSFIVHEGERRLIDNEYTLPRPVGDKFVKYLYEHYDFSSLLNSDARRQYRFGDETEELLTNRTNLV